jgi:hypothetical protein
MLRSLLLSMALTIIAPSLSAIAQDSEPSDEKAAPAESTETAVRKEADELVSDTKQHVDAIARQVDRDERARGASAGLLSSIYRLAEFLSFPAFHWVAFACMVAGVVSFAFQLVLGKLVVLSRFSLSPAEILSDSLGLVISGIGLVLTTQAATENSRFTESPASVLSSAAVGALAGLIFYRWGQRLELDAVAGRTRQNPPPPAR